MNTSFLKKKIPGWARLLIFIGALWYFEFLWPLLTGDIFIETQMPGKSFNTPLPAASDEEMSFKASLDADVKMLSETIGERNVWKYDALKQSAAYIGQRLSQCGYEAKAQSYKAYDRDVENIYADLKGRDEQILVVGAHYDSVRGTTGANDNASGVAAMLTLACALQHHTPEHSIRFVAFVNEEPPFFQTKLMGSLVFARHMRTQNEAVFGAISLETMGFYSSEKNSQSYPFPLSYFYPAEGNFIGFVGNNPSSDFLKSAIISFRKHARFPSEGAVVPAIIPGAGWSDHWSFWKEGYPGIMITDTAPFRYPFYHSHEDTPDKIDFDSLARVVSGLNEMLIDLSGTADSRKITNR